MNSLYSILAQAAPAAESAPQGSSSTMLIMMLLLLGGMYFLMIAPQRKRQKQHEKMLSELQTGDTVVTIGGIFGTITNRTDKTFVIRVDDGVKIEILKSAVSSKIEPGKTVPEEDKK